MTAQKSKKSNKPAQSKDKEDEEILNILESFAQARKRDKS